MWAIERAATRREVTAMMETFAPRVTLLVALAALAACSCGAPAPPPREPQAAAEPASAAEPTPPPPPAPAPATSTEIANPASTKCVDAGGKLELRTEPAGEVGVCVFDDGSRCEEWAHFRGKCRKGDCRADDGRCGARP
jgi:putative hemolysin